MPISSTEKGIMDGVASKDREYAKEMLKSRGLVAFNMIPPRFHKFGTSMNLSQFEYYSKKVEESDGYDVSGCTGTVCDGIVEIKNKEEVIPAAKFAVEQHNAETGASLKFVEIVRVNYQLLGIRYVYYYITLKAIDEQNNNQSKLYRAKVERHPIKTILGETEADRKYTLESFCLSPQQTLKPSPVRPPVLQAKRKPKKRQRSPDQSMWTPRRPFYKFVMELRTFYEHANKPFYDVVSFAKDEWKSFSPEDRACYSKGS